MLVLIFLLCQIFNVVLILSTGGIDEGEDPATAALREVAEETSICSARIVGELDQWLTYDFPTVVRA
jgi:8-oxo-dGTP pyrophosphatase MutT (NUDIX family)